MDKRIITRIKVGASKLANGRTNEEVKGGSVVERVNEKCIT